MFGFSTFNLSHYLICILFSRLEEFPFGCSLTTASVAFCLQALREGRPFCYLSLEQSYYLNLLIIHVLPEFWILREYFGGSLISACSVTHSCLILCNPSDYSPPGFSVHWIILIQIMEWVAISPSKGSSQPRTELTSPAALALAGDSVSLSHLGSPSLKSSCNVTLLHIF